MILERGNMWDVFGKTDIFFITTNPIIRKDGAIVMGRGIAKEAATRFPDLPFKFAKRYTEAKYEQDYVDVLAFVNTGLIGRYDNQVVGWFMVKDHWRNPADISIIERSTRELMRWAYFKGHLEGFVNRVDINFPGIGNGKLDRFAVLPIIEQLPDNVHVWEYA